MLVTNPRKIQTSWQAQENNKKEVAGVLVAIIVSINASWKDWKCKDEQKAKSLSVEKWFNAIGFDIQFSRHVKLSNWLHVMATYLRSRPDLQGSQHHSDLLFNHVEGCQKSEILYSLTLLCQSKVWPKNFLCLDFPKT